MAIDVQFPLASSRSIVSAVPGVVANKRHHDSSIASLVRDILHVRSVWEVVNPTAGSTILVLGLVEDNRSSIRNLALGDGCGNIGNVAISAC